jgi:hypothetical protein
MSDKHLTVLPWKTLAGKHKIKETKTKLAIELTDLGECKPDDAEGRLKILALIKKDAETLKEEHEENQEVKTYLKVMLEEVVKDVEKSRKAAEQLKKAPKEKPPEEAKPEAEKKDAPPKEEKEKEEKEAAEAKKKVAAAPPANPKLKSLLTTTMGKVKARKPTDPPIEAMLCQMGTEFGVLLAGNVGPAQQSVLKELLKGTGHKFVKGTCEWGAGDIYTFILQSPLGGAAQGLKLFFQKYAGVGYKLRVGMPGAMEEDLTEAGAQQKAAEATGGDKPPGDKQEPKVASSPMLPAYVNAIKDWKAAKADALKGITALKAAILQQCDPELEAPVKAKIDVWDGILGVVDDKLLVPLIDAAMKETVIARQAEHNQKLAGLMTNLTAALQQHSLASVADANPFGNFSIRAPLDSMLSRLGQTFSVPA